MNYKNPIIDINNRYFFIFNKLKNLSIKFFEIPQYIFAIIIIIITRSVKPYILIRFRDIHSDRIGHFAANTELYLCEKKEGINIPNKKYKDFFICSKTVCNKFLLQKWRTIIKVYNFYVFGKVILLLEKIPRFKEHLVGNNLNSSRDIMNLLDKYNCDIKFDKFELSKAQNILDEMGIPKEAEFICLIVRDSAYLENTIKGTSWDYHNYRDSKIENYELVCETLANKGYYIFRMGVKVNGRLNSNNKRIIDYANSKYRSDFLDIYLGSKCKFCISTGTGFDSVPMIFRRPIVYVNLMPFGYIPSYRNCFFAITKHHISTATNEELNLNQIFEKNVAFSLSSIDFEKSNIYLKENTPEEIRDIVLEMNIFLSNVNNYNLSSEQKLFLDLYNKNLIVNNSPKVHGQLKFKYGDNYLINNPWFLHTT